MIHNELFNFVFSPEQLAESLKSQANSSLWLSKIDEAIQGFKYTKGQLLMSAGQTPDQIYFLTNGAARAYYLDDEGNQHTFYLWDEFALVTDIVNYIQRAPSDLFIEVCEEATFQVLQRVSLEKILREFPESLLFLQSVLLHFTKHHRGRDKESQIMKARERFLELTRINKKIEQRFSRKWIASYLGMSRGWLYDMNSKDK